MPKIILITGASSGIGAACARHLAALGHRVYGTSRRAPAPAQATPDDDGVIMLRMDVTDEASVQRAVEHVLAREGRLDVLINGAGDGIAGAVEDTAMDEAHAQLDTNFFGTLCACRAVLPAMRAQGDGLIVNISSIGGGIGLPFQAMYSASKFALEGMSEALRIEVRPYGIRVVLVEPGDMRTGFTANRRMVAAHRETSPYYAAGERAVAVMVHDEENGASPELVARLVARLMAKKSPRLRYMVGPIVEQTALLLKRVLPWRLFEAALRLYYKV